MSTSLHRESFSEIIRRADTLNIVKKLRAEKEDTPNPAIDRQQALVSRYKNLKEDLAEKLLKKRFMKLREFREFTNWLEENRYNEHHTIFYPLDMTDDNFSAMFKNSTSDFTTADKIACIDIWGRLRSLAKQIYSIEAPQQSR